MLDGLREQLHLESTMYHVFMEKIASSSCCESSVAQSLMIELPTIRMMDLLAAPQSDKGSRTKCITIIEATSLPTPTLSACPLQQC